jgi:hypothetical protein
VTLTKGSSADGVSMRECVEREREHPHKIPVPWLEAATCCTSIGASVATHDCITFCISAVQAALHCLALLEDNTGCNLPDTRHPEQTASRLPALCYIAPPYAARPPHSLSDASAGYCGLSLARFYDKTPHELHLSKTYSLLQLRPPCSTPRAHRAHS